MLGPLLSGAEPIESASIRADAVQSRCVLESMMTT